MLFGAHLLGPDTLLNNEEAPYYSQATLTCTYARPYPVWQRMVMNSSVTLGYRHFHGLRSGSGSHRSPTLGRGVKHDGGGYTLALSLAGYSSGIFVLSTISKLTKAFIDTDTQYCAYAASDCTSRA